MAFPVALPCPAESLFHDPNGTAFADLAIDGHRETWPIRSRQFRHCLRRRHYEETGSAASAETIRSALDLLEARAQFDAPERTAHIRVAEHDGRIYLDLADKDWRAVQIGPDGWQVVTSPPVRFRRAAGMLPLPIPQRGGSVEALAAVLNLPAPDEFVLVVAWLLATLQWGGPYPVLVIAGEQGSAKTVLTKILRALIDPNAAPTRALPREERDLMIAANHGHVIAFDNLSSVPSWVSDALCRLASGGSFAIRQLYTDCDEVLFHAARPAILNGIEDVVCRSDLADRAMFLTLRPIADERRRTERQLWREFEVVRPRILGALLDAAAHGLRRLSRVQLECSPRMADFALWATACETAFWPAGTFLPFMMPTVGPRSKASLRPTPWPFSCGRSWPCAAHGQVGPRIFCAPVLPQVRMCRTEPQDGRKIRAPWPADCVAARRSSGPSALILPLVAKAERAAG
jgi:hypothetical protein